MGTVMRTRKNKSSAKYSPCRRYSPAFELLEDRRVLSATLVSVAAGGTVPSSYVGSVSADGRYVAFESYSDTLVGNDHNGKRDVFVRDLITGTTELISKESTGTTSAN